MGGGGGGSNMGGNKGICLDSTKTKSDILLSLIFFSSLFAASPVLASSKAYSKALERKFQSAHFSLGLQGCPCFKEP